MYRIAVMGDRDSIYGFASVGLDIFPVGEDTNAGRLLRQLADGDYAVIYMTEALYTRLAKEVEVYRERALPTIIPIPGVNGNNSCGIAGVRKSVEQAVGSDIIFGK